MTHETALETTADEFLGGRLSILQPTKGPRAGIDAVLLAAAVPARPGERVFEAGMGTGVVALALAHRVAGINVTGIELQPELAGLARENIRRNRLQDSVQAVEGDVTGPVAQLERDGIARETFDHVLANPPFHIEGEVRAARDTVKRLAHAAGKDDLDLWIKTLTTLAAPGGTVTLIHRASALGDVLGNLARRFGGVTVYPLFPRPGEAASRVIVQGVKGSRAPLRLAPGLVLHRDDGGFTPEAEKVLRHGAGLSLLG